MAASPFHRGEELVQTRIGVRDTIEKKGRVVIRTAMPKQHRKLFATLPLLVGSTVEPHGQPGASMLCGAPGLVSSPEPGLLIIDAWPPADDPRSSGGVRRESQNARPCRDQQYVGDRIPLPVPDRRPHRPRRHRLLPRARRLVQRVAVVHGIDIKNTTQPAALLRLGE
jgi:hypothetical protein